MMMTWAAAAACILGGAGPPNVVLLSVDTLRADHLGCYGYGRDASPNIDALAKGSRVYLDAVCELPLTVPSFSSMFTGRPPRVNGNLRNSEPLPERLPVVAERFQEAGYATWCVQSNWTLKPALSGLDRGFEVYDAELESARWYGVYRSERVAEDVTDRALELLRARDPDRPFFAWVHYVDPHAPYDFHGEHNSARKPFAVMTREERTRARYDSEVAYMDHHLGRLLDELPQKNTYVVFLSDHGESLHEHGYVGHGRRLYQPGMRIPFMVRGPGIKPLRTTLPVRGADVGPTLLALAGLQPLPGAVGVDVLGDEAPRRRPRFMETYGGEVIDVFGAEERRARQGVQIQGLLEGPWKYLVSEEFGRELYHIRRDPGELNNVIADHPARAEYMAGQLQEWDEETPLNRAEQAEMTDDDRRALESLGYLE